jgi:lysine 6-dehydrogenase
MEYKTLRYPGHAAIFAALRELGFFDREPVHVKGHRVVPRDLTIALMEERLTRQHGTDMVALWVVVSGRKDALPATIEWRLLDRHDGANGVSAMMRTTGYSLALTGIMQLEGRAGGPGVRTPDEAVAADYYVAELRKRGINLELTASTG